MFAHNGLYGACLRGRVVKVTHQGTNYRWRSHDVYDFLVCAGPPSAIQRSCLGDADGIHLVKRFAQTSPKCYYSETVLEVRLNLIFSSFVLVYLLVCLLVVLTVGQRAL